jgi:hypothetical protein
MIRCARNKTILSLVVFATIAGQVVPAKAQCRTDARSAAASKGWVDTEGVRHISYRIPDGWGAAQEGKVNVKAIIEEAAAQWNAHSGTTKVRFESYDPQKQPEPDIEFAFLGSGATSCAGYEPSETGGKHWIRVNLNFFDAPSSLGEKVKRPIGHEFGHALDLDESNQADSIMKVPAYVNCNHTAIETFPDSQVTAGDAAIARDCINAITKRDSPFNGDEEQDYKDLEYSCECNSCWVLYDVDMGYMYVENANGDGGYYEAVEIDRYVWDEGCGPPPV